jgi:hypothetical protein
MVEIQKLNQNLFRPFFTSLEKFQMRYEDVDGLLLMRDWLADHASEQLLTEFNAEFGEEMMMVENPPSFKWYEYLYWFISEFNQFIINGFMLSWLIFICMVIGANLSKIYQEMPSPEQIMAMAIQVGAISWPVLSSLTTNRADDGWANFRQWLPNVFFAALVFTATFLIVPPPHPAEKVVLPMLETAMPSIFAFYLLVVLVGTALLRLSQFAYDTWEQQNVAKNA